MTSIEDQVRVYAEAITDDAPTRIARVIETAADPFALKELTDTADTSARSVAPSGRSGRGRPRASRRAWWATAAAAVVVLVAVGVVSLRHHPADRSVQTPAGKVQPDSYPNPGVKCGGDRVTDATSLAGPASLNACIGVAATTRDAKVVYLTSNDGSQILGGWAVSDCPSYYSSSGGQLEPGNDDAPHLMIGMVTPDTAAQQFELTDGTVLTAATVQIEGIENAAFYAVVVPNAPSIRSSRALNAVGDRPAQSQPGCTPGSVTLPPEIAQPMAAALIAETSQAMGVKVGDSCPPEDGKALPASLPMVAGIAGNVHDDTCHIVGWMTRDSIPGLSGSALYAQDGTVIADHSPAPSGGESPDSTAGDPVPAS